MSCRVAGRRTSKALLGMGLMASMAVVAPQTAEASPQAALEFQQLLRAELSPEQLARPESKLLHFAPDHGLLAAESATSIAEAIRTASASSLDSLAGENVYPMDPGAYAAEAKKALSKHSITLVVIPGIFGEFIRVRPFENVLARPSQAKDQFIAAAARARTDANPARRALGVDATYSSEDVSVVSKPIEELVHVGEAGPNVKVVFLYPRLASLETLGDLKDRAAIFNRRLEKYLELSGDQNLAFVGFSRGTTYGLEMISQGFTAGKPWVSRVRAMIGLGGVVFGSSAADQTADPNHPMAKTLQALKRVSASLQVLPEALWSRPGVIYDNNKAWSEFLSTMKEIDAETKSVNPDGAVEVNTTDPSMADSLMQMDAMGPLALSYKFLLQLGLTKPFSDYSNNIRRGKALIDAAITGIEQLRTAERLEWWRTHRLPLTVKYYALAGAMASPSESAVGRMSFESPLTYANRAVEDVFLLKNRNDYVTASGLRLNDSQVGVPQAMFLPKVIENLNPELRGIRTEFLGVMGTHHWGLALPIVFDMRDGRKNPTPREAMLKAMAAKIAFDIEHP
ncbi:MAG: hypothetical protein JNJ49_16060 [Bdellovibrionaceae bacterium]|nr:hypothetical protein [Pseudobdellovibrionaceae bacterium]